MILMIITSVAVKIQQNTFAPKKLFKKTPLNWLKYDVHFKDILK